MKSNIQEEINKICQHGENKTPKISPKKLLIEVTNRCNCRCIFCANRKMTRKHAYISGEIVFKALKQASEMNVKEVGFYANGEPLLNKELDKYILYAKQLGYEYIYITTNGILADKDYIENLFKNGLDSIKFSINSIYKENYKLIHNVDKFETVIKNLKLVYELKKNKYKDKKIFVSYIKTNMNDYNEEDIKEFFEKYCDNVIVQYARNQGGLISNIEKIKCNNNEHYGAPCYYPFNSLIVSCEGYVSACCMDFQNYLAYGDLNIDEFSDIWNNKIINDFRTRQLNNDLEGTLCDNCIKNKFNKCNPITKEYCTQIDFEKWKE